MHYPHCGCYCLLAFRSVLFGHNRTLVIATASFTSKFFKTDMKRLDLKFQPSKMFCKIRSMRWYIKQNVVNVWTSWGTCWQQHPECVQTLLPFHLCFPLVLWFHLLPANQEISQQERQEFRQENSTGSIRILHAVTMFAFVFPTLTPRCPGYPTGPCIPRGPYK